MKIPKTLNILGFQWKVKLDESVASEGGVYGSTHHGTQVIYLDPTNTEQKMEETLLHEAMHAIFWQTGLGKRYNDVKVEEEIISALATGVYQLLKDNKFVI